MQNMERDHTVPRRGRCYDYRRARLPFLPFMPWAPTFLAEQFISDLNNTKDVFGRLVQYHGTGL
jgi:hypothetical protein